MKRTNYFDNSDLVTTKERRCGAPGSFLHRNLVNANEPQLRQG